MVDGENDKTLKVEKNDVQAFNALGFKSLKKKTIAGEQ